MASQQTQVDGLLPHNCATVWQQLYDLRRDWHPLVEQQQWQLGPSGQVQLQFTTEDGSHYCEQRTFLSHSKHWLGYRMVSGIAGIDAYSGWVELQQQAQACHISWQAKVTAEHTLARRIADASKPILQAGIDALDKAQALTIDGTPDVPLLSPLPISKETLPGTPDLQVHCCNIQPQPKVLLVFLHGIGGAGSNWHHQLARLGHLIPSVALDLRGYGGSQLGPKNTQINDYHQDILRLKQHYGAEKLILCGLSYGAWIATSFACLHSHIMQGLIVSGGCTGMSEATEAERQAFLQSRQVPLSRGQTPADFAASVVALICGSQATAEQKQLLQQSMAAIPADTYADALQCFCSPPERLAFNHLRCPILLMTGDEDKLASEEEITSLALRLHNLTLVDQGPAWVQLEILANCGHVCNILQAEAYTQHLVNFVSTCIESC